MNEQDVIQAILMMAGFEILLVFTIWGAIRAKTRIMGSQEAECGRKSRESEDFRAII